MIDDDDPEIALTVLDCVIDPSNLAVSWFRRICSSSIPEIALPVLNCSIDLCN